MYQARPINTRRPPGIVRLLRRYRATRRALHLLGILTLQGIPALAATFTVTTETDDNGTCEIDDCSLREAVLAANASPGHDVIIVPGGTYRLTLTGPADEDDSVTGDLDVWGLVDILGDPHDEVVILGPPNERVFFLVVSGRISNLTIKGGNTGAWGGGIYTIGNDLTIENCRIVENSAEQEGGGLRNDAGTVLIINSTIGDNRASRGGGFFQSAGTMSHPSQITLINSTVSRNSATVAGGGISHFGRELRVINSTIFGNLAPSGSAIFDWGERIAWTNALVEGECEVREPRFQPVSNGGNMESPGATCYFSDPTDRMNVPELLLGPLADNGGPTPTHALLPGSPAVDAGVNAGCPPTDQRGFRRPALGDLDNVARCDVGAFELGAAPPVDVPAISGPGLVLLALLLAAIAAQRLRTGHRLWWRPRRLRPRLGAGDGEGRPARRRPRENPSRAPRGHDQPA